MDSKSSRWLLLVTYTTLVGLTSAACWAVDPLKQMMILNGAYSHLPPAEQQLVCTNVMGVALSSSIFLSFVAGVFIDTLGMKLTAVMGHACLILGYSGLFGIFGTGESGFVMYSSALLLGFAYPAIFAPHTTISVLFPEMLATSLTVIGSAPDFAQLVPFVLYKIAQSVGVKLIVSIYISVVLVIGGLEMLILPFQPHGKEVELEEVEDNNDEIVPLLALHETLADKPLLGQIFSAPYWIFFVFLAFNVFRKFHVQQNIRPMMIEIAGGDLVRASALVEVYNATCPLAFAVSMIWGVVVDRIGILLGLGAFNASGLIMVLSFGTPSLAVQPFSVFMYIVFSSFVFGAMYSFIVKFYGFKYLGTLQGTMMGMTGILMLLFGVWNQFIEGYLQGSYIEASYYLVAISAIMFVVPLLLCKYRSQISKAPTPPSTFTLDRHSSIALGSSFRSNGKRLSHGTRKSSIMV